MPESKTVYKKSEGLSNIRTTYCPGCTHGIIHKLVAECLVDLDVLDRTIGISSVGCSALNYDFFSCDMQQAAHGRAPAVATGIKRVRPNSIIFTYQGDGDLASIGIAEAIHAAHRGENITIVFVNNAIYGMTGGQMAPTTLIGQKTTTSQDGRDAATTGLPLRISEMMATIPGATYIERVSVHDPKHVNRAKKALKKAFQIQKDNKGFTLIEFISTCPVNWGMTPKDAVDWAVDNMIPYYPLGVFKDKTVEEEK
ncbi:2-oxoglutarate oxidoreductase subunit KorB [Candidatus Izimaplasma bacterium HR1]|jgi:2-oxoglutarate ferredoxin oxidoreductase subunit beta|uniref:thiamine pyrophosphate-dependent enzyme n=1 Tax=Candidatus Izimoplasma sp. HR1 TaxID=1541959 RepID=UPI0004F5F7F1|nr:2-oxoglutarate oxidoreductase subunit KorB [Candidatus Izimaplasma bacterium HR1]